MSKKSSSRRASIIIGKCKICQKIDVPIITKVVLGFPPKSVCLNCFFAQEKKKKKKFEIRNDLIKDLRTKNFSLREIASLFNLSAPRVLKILSSYEK